LSTTTHAIPGGTNRITAHYGGDATFAPSDSAQVQVTVNPEPSATTVKVLTADSNGQPIPFTSGVYGGFVDLRVDVAGNSGFGTPTGWVTFSDNTGYAASSNLNSQGNTAPAYNGVSNFTVGAHSMTAT
jgi:hypothetical protein